MFVSVQLLELFRLLRSKALASTSLMISAVYHHSLTSSRTDSTQ